MFQIRLWHLYSLFNSILWFFRPTCNTFMTPFNNWSDKKPIDIYALDPWLGDYCLRTISLVFASINFDAPPSSIFWWKKLNPFDGSNCAHECYPEKNQDEANETNMRIDDVSKCGFRYVRYAFNEMAWNNIAGKMVMFKSLAYTPTHRANEPANR